MARNKFDVDEVIQIDGLNVNAFARLAKYISPYKNDIILTIAIMLISSALALVSPYLMKIAIDTYIPDKNIPGICILSAMLVCILILNAVCVRIRIYKMSKVGQSIIRDLRLDLYSHLQKLPFSYFDSRPLGKILVRVVNYVNSLSDMLSNGIINLVTDSFSLIVIVVIMLSMNVKLTLVSMSGIPFLVMATLYIKNKQRVYWREHNAKQSNMNAYLHESITGMKITQSFVREDTNRGIFDSVSAAARDTWMRAVRVMFLMAPAADNISVWTASFLYVAGVSMIIGGNVSVGMLVAFISYVSRFWGPINNIANIYNSIVINLAYLERIIETIDEPEIVKDVAGATIMPPVKGDVEFREVTFSYDPGRPILKSINFNVKSGDTIALVGPTGAGKTTVVNLLSRFYDIDSGTIFLDGNDIKGVTLNSLRSQMGIMLQDSFIFSGTVMDNIRYSKLDANDEEVMAAAKAVKAHDFIIEMEKGYDTEVNERGSRLSAGQRQLISFARALLADPRILILDEATSSIDTKTELVVQEGLSRLLVGRTSFIIAHRLSTIKNATRIMYVDKGNILESGSHDELMKQRGHYYELYTSQYSWLKAM